MRIDVVDLGDIPLLNAGRDVDGVRPAEVDLVKRAVAVTIRQSAVGVGVANSRSVSFEKRTHNP
jgi:hypothetical protein